MKPNLIIPGAPRSATTWLAQYLSKHDDIFAPSIKEPRFFLKDPIVRLPSNDNLKNFLLQTSVLDENEYFGLYNTNQKNYKYYVDASVHYLFYYAHVIPQIKEKLGDSVFIILILRNPIDRAVSNYAYIKKKFCDKTFEEIIKGEFRDEFKNHYAFHQLFRQGLYFDGVDAFLKNFKNVQILFYDELENADLVKEKLSKFLKLDFNPISFPMIANTSSAKSFTSFLSKKQKKTVLNLMCIFFGQKKTHSFIQKIKDILFFFKKEKVQIQDVCSPELFQLLQARYRGDIVKLEGRLNVDLSKRKV